MKLTTQQIINAVGFALMNPKNHCINGNYSSNNRNCYCPVGLYGLISGEFPTVETHMMLDRLFDFSAKTNWDYATEMERLELARKMYQYRENV